jgi:nicotinamide-nucleotide amidase
LDPEEGALGADGSVASAAMSLFRALSERKLRIACAESCTGGLVTAAITEIPGSSAVLWGGVAAYSNECKSLLLDVPPSLIEAHGAVSREVARAMAEGVLAAGDAADAVGADLSLAITGVAGPEGGSAEKPVGLVWFAWRTRSGIAFEESALFPGDRKAVREAAAIRALSAAATLALGLAPAEARY